MDYMLRRPIYDFFRMNQDSSDPTEPQITYTRLFKRGYVTLITDDLLVHDPVRSLLIIRNFHKDNLVRSQKNRVNKLYFRPQILRFVETLAKAANESGKDERISYMELYALLYQLTFPTTKIEGTDEAISLVEEIPLIVSEDGAGWEDYDQLWNDDPAGATEFLVQMFIAWTLMQVEELRRYSIILPAGKAKAEDPRLKKWNEEFKHVWAVGPDLYQESLKTGLPPSK